MQLIAQCSSCKGPRGERNGKALSGADDVCAVANPSIEIGMPNLFLFYIRWREIGFPKKLFYINSAFLSPYRILTQLLCEFALAAIGKLIYQRVKTRRMIVMNGVAQLVNDDIVAQMLGKSHQV